MIVETKVVGRAAEFADRTIALPVGAGTLRALLGELVRVEVAEYDARRAQQSVLRVLTPADVAAGSATGRISSGGHRAPAPPSVDVAVQRALEAFRDGLYFVFLDDVQLEDLDAPIAVGPASRLRLVRLVALAGG